MLRKFLFLDDSSVRDYLAVLEGYVTDEEVGHIEKGQTEVGASISFSPIGAKAEKGKESEDRSKLRIPPPAQFERLYKLLEKSGHIQQLDAFDQGIWDQIKSGEMLEIQADIRFPDLFNTLLAVPKAAETLDSIVPLLEVFDTFGPLIAGEDEQGLSIDSRTREQLRGFGAIGGAMSELANQATAKIPIVFEAINSRNFRFYARLPQQYMRVDLRDLEGQAYVFGKVFRKVPRGQELEVFSLVPGLTNIAGPLNRHQRRAMKKTASDPTNKIKGPAIVLDPVAIFR